MYTIKDCFLLHPPLCFLHSIEGVWVGEKPWTRLDYFLGWNSQGGVIVIPSTATQRQYRPMKCKDIAKWPYIRQLYQDWTYCCRYCDVKLTWLTLLSVKTVPDVLRIPHYIVALSPAKAVQTNQKARISQNGPISVNCAMVEPTVVGAVTWNWHDKHYFQLFKLLMFSEYPHYLVAFSPAKAVLYIIYIYTHYRFKKFLNTPIFPVIYCNSSRSSPMNSLKWYKGELPEVKKRLGYPKLKNNVHFRIIQKGLFQGTWNGLTI